MASGSHQKAVGLQDAQLGPKTSILAAKRGARAASLSPVTSVPSRQFVLITQLQHKAFPELRWVIKTDGELNGPGSSSSF